MSHIWSQDRSVIELVQSMENVAQSATSLQAVINSQLASLITLGDPRVSSAKGKGTIAHAQAMADRLVDAVCELVPNVTNRDMFNNTLKKQLTRALKAVGISGVKVVGSYILPGNKPPKAYPQKPRFHRYVDNLDFPWVIDLRIEVVDRDVDPFDGHTSLTARDLAEIANETAHKEDQAARADAIVDRIDDGVLPGNPVANEYKNLSSEDIATAIETMVDKWASSQPDPVYARNQVYDALMRFEVS